MRILYDHAGPEQRAQALAILLPGALQQPEDLVQAGFAAAVRERGLSLDLALVDLDMRYVGEALDGAALRRLHDGVVEPARLRGYADIWLGGISIGGFIALAYAGAYPGRVDGLCLLAPYPGSRLVTNEIGAAGGIAQWRADGAGDDAERRVWRFLRSGIPHAPRLYYGYALQDRFAPGQQLMAAAFPDECVDRVAGTHDWPAWRQLWDNFLDRVAPRLRHAKTDNIA